MSRSSVRWMVPAVLLLATAVAHGQTPADSPGGQRLPAPFGIGVTAYNQTQDYNLESLTLGLPGIDTGSLGDLPVDNRTDSYHLKLDWWAFPFLNVYAIGGRLQTTTRVHLKDIDIGLPFPLADLKIDNDGWVYGGGVTFAVGGKGWFGTLSTTYTRADLEVTDGSVEAWVVTPKVGLTAERGAVWIGAMYQDAEERHRGTYNIPFVGSVPFEVTLGEASPWNGLIGGAAGLSEHFVLLIEGGFGSRQTVLLSLEYRP